MSARTAENRLRRMAAREGFRLIKSRRRDPNAIGYGGFMIVDVRTNTRAFGLIDSPEALDLVEVEAFLTGDAVADEEPAAPAVTLHAVTVSFHQQPVGTAPGPVRAYRQPGGLADFVRKQGIAMGTLYNPRNEALNAERVRRPT